jgi:TonB family protein
MDLQLLLLTGTRVIGWTLLHFVWQGALLGLLYALGRAVMPRGEVRYRFGMGILFVLALCPLLTARLLLGAEPSALAPAAGNGAAPVMLAGYGAGTALDVGGAWGNWLDTLLPWLVLAWLSGVILLSLRAWRQWRGLKALVRMAELLPHWRDRATRMAERFGLRRRVMVLCSGSIATPALVGWIRPVILLPTAVACGFPAAQIELVLAHEMAHLRRWDPLANLFQVVLETLHFYHPVVHWISRDVRNEREICCDEMALSVSGGSRHEFVAVLAELGELREQHGTLLLAASGGVLLDRVQQMVVPARDSVRARTPARFVAVLLGAALLALTLRIEWRQAQLQHSLDGSITQLQSALMPPWLLSAATTSRIAWHLPDLVPSRAEVVRPLFKAGPAVVLTPSRALSLDLVVGAQPMHLQVSNLAAGHDRVLRVAEQLAPATVEALTPVRIRQPAYPQGALMSRIEGKVTLEFGLAADGSVQDLHVISATPVGVFDQAAIQAMRGWKYAMPQAVSPQHRYRQTMAFMLNAAATGKAAAHAYSGAEIAAQVGCRVTTGTHICRRPDDMESRSVGIAGATERH